MQESEQQRRLSILAYIVVLVMLLLWWFASSAKAASAATGTGYTPPQSTACHRSMPGGPMVRTSGNLASSDPWNHLQCNVDPTIGCISAAPVAALFTARYGFPDTDRLGGWCGASSERASVIQRALRWFCANLPARIRSAGAAGGYDCIPTVEEVFDVLAFDDGDRLNRDYEQAIGTTPPPVAGCVAPKVCILPCAACQPCAVCPPAVVCPPPPVLLDLTSQDRADCDALRLPSTRSRMTQATQIRTKRLCDKLDKIKAYVPSVSSTARNDLTLAECLGVAQ